MTCMVMVTPVFAVENSEAMITETHRAYEQIGDDATEGIRVRKGELVTILDEADGYYKVMLEDEEVVYIETQYIEKTEEEIVVEEDVIEEEVIIEEETIIEQETQEVVEPKVEAKEAPKMSKGEEVVSYAKQFIGTPYAYAGNSLTGGVDCSGFTSQVYKKFNVSLQRRSGDQYASNGQRVSRSELEMGDLVFFGYNGNISHVGIYAGNGNMVHASSSRGVVVDPLDLRGMEPIAGYKRVI